MYNSYCLFLLIYLVTGPCEFLVMYNSEDVNADGDGVTGPCEFLVMYN